jgi:hypothetical protein
MEERRQQSYIKGPDMDDIKDRLSRIEKQGVDALVSTSVLENSFTSHADQNVKDFKHVDECIHRSEAESKGRDESLAQQIEKMAQDIKKLTESDLESKKFQWKFGGALLVLVPLANHFLGKLL